MDRKAALALGLQVMRDSPEWSEGRERAGVSATVRRKWLIGPRKSWVVRTRTVAMGEYEDECTDEQKIV